MPRAAQAQINLSALQHNLKRVREISPQCRIMAVIKANGYGHGMERVARVLSSLDVDLDPSVAAAGTLPHTTCRDAQELPHPCVVDAFGVASIDEAITLREAGITAPITLLEGFFEAAELMLIQQHSLDVVIHHPAQLAVLEATLLTTPITVWLKVDSGMHRLGFAPEQVSEVWHRLVACRSVRKPVRLMTHLASADDLASPQTSQQLACFNAATAEINAERSIANSAAILGWPQTHSTPFANWVRPGIMLYGVSPFINGTAADHNLKPVMTLTSQLITINHYKQGDAIGYAASWVCPHDMPVGVVAMGYGDGYPRHAVSGTPVLVNGKRVPLIGRVSMDMLSVDLSTQPQAHIGDAVTLWGEGLPVEEVARSASTIPYQLLCGVTQRVKFVEV